MHCYRNRYPVRLLFQVLRSNVPNYGVMKEVFMGKGYTNQHIVPQSYLKRFALEFTI